MSKEVVVFVRDINCLTQDQFKEQQTRVAQIKNEAAFAKIQFLIIKSFVKEIDHMLKFENMDLAREYYRSNIVSTRSIKEILNKPI